MCKRLPRWACSAMDGDDRAGWNMRARCGWRTLRAAPGQRPEGSVRDAACPSARVRKQVSLVVALPLLAVMLGDPAAAQTGITPQAGIYRVGGVGQSFELSAVTSASMTTRHWQTETPAPPPPESGAFFSAGTARLLADGVTWRMLNRGPGGLLLRQRGGAGVPR